MSVLEAPTSPAKETPADRYGALKRRVLELAELHPERAPLFPEPLAERRQLGEQPRALRPVRRLEPHLEERRELLEGIVEGLRDELARPEPGAAGVFERLLTHLAAPPVSAHKPCHYLC